MNNRLENIPIKIIPFEVSVLSVFLSGFSSFSFRYPPCSSAFWLKTPPERLLSAFSRHCAVWSSYLSDMYFPQANLQCFATFICLFADDRLMLVERTTGVVRLNDWSHSFVQLQWVSCNVADWLLHIARWLSHTREY